MTDHLPITKKFTALGPILTEQGRRLWAATEAMVLGRGGVSLVAQATGLARPTIDAGIQELRGEPAAIPGCGQGRSRRAGGGRQRRVEHDPTLLADLEALVEPTFAIELAEREKRRLQARLPLMLDEIRADVDVPDTPSAEIRAAAAAIGRAMTEYIERIEDGKLAGYPL